MRISGWKSARRLVRQLHARWRPGGLILGYHRIAAVAQDPFGLCVQPNHFAEQMAVVRNWAKPVSLAELYDGWQNCRIPPRAVAITFDDGYADTLYEALPILQQFEIPATVFVTTGNLGQEFWWDRLERLILTATTLADMLMLHERSYPTSSRLQLLQSMAEMIRGLKPIQQQQCLAQIESQLGGTAVAHCRALTPSEISLLTNEPLLEVGAHTVHHPVLSTLTIAEQRCEIKGSKNFLEELTQRPIVGFSYPNGDASATTRQLVQTANYRYACTSDNNVVRPTTNPWQWPRFWVGDVNREQFGRWLRRWL